MEFLEHTLVVLHFIGLASLLGGFLVQIRSTVRVVNPAMVHGVLTQLITGVLLVGLAEADDAEVNNAKIGVKLLVLAVIAVLVFVNRRRDAVATGVWAAIGALTVANIVVAVFW